MIATQRQNGMAEGWDTHLHVTRRIFLAYGGIEF